MTETDNQRENINNVIHCQKIQADGNDVSFLMMRKLSKGGFETSNETWTFKNVEQLELVKQFKEIGGVHKENYRLINVLADLKKKEVLEDV